MAITVPKTLDRCLTAAWLALLTALIVGRVIAQDPQLPPGGEAVRQIVSVIPQGRLAVWLLIGGSLLAAAMSACLWYWRSQLDVVAVWRGITIAAILNLGLSLILYINIDWITGSNVPLLYGAGILVGTLSFLFMEFMLALRGGAKEKEEQNGRIDHSR
jgi:hypothetical protein